MSAALLAFGSMSTLGADYRQSGLSPTYSDFLTQLAQSCPSFIFCRHLQRTSNLVVAMSAMIMAQSIFIAKASSFWLFVQKGNDWEPRA